MSLYGTLASTTFKNAAGTTVARPHFMAYATWGSYTHNCSNSDNTSYTNQSGRQVFPAYNNVDGLNTTGFNTSSTPGNCYYDIPLDGIYIFSFMNLVDTYINGVHLDSIYNITDSATNTFRAQVPWSTQYLGTNIYTAGSGFSRILPSVTGAGINTAPGCTIVGRFYQGQRIRPQITMNSATSISVYGNAHNFFHGTYIGA